MEQDVPAVRARRSGRSRVVGAPRRCPRVPHSALKEVRNVHPSVEPSRGRHGARSPASTGHRPVDRRVRVPTLRSGPRDSVPASERGDRRSVRPLLRSPRPRVDPRRSERAPQMMFPRGTQRPIESRSRRSVRVSPDESPGLGLPSGGRSRSTPSFSWARSPAQGPLPAVAGRRCSLSPGGSAARP